RGGRHACAERGAARARERESRDRDARRGHRQAAGRVGGRRHVHVRGQRQFREPRRGLQQLVDHRRSNGEATGRDLGRHEEARARQLRVQVRGQRLDVEAGCRQSPVEGRRLRRQELGRHGAAMMRFRTDGWRRRGRKRRCDARHMGRAGRVARPFRDRIIDGVEAHDSSRVTAATGSLVFTTDAGASSDAEVLMKAATKLIVLLAAGTLGAWSAPASAQGTGRSMDFDLSIRSAGMGGASNAVVWGHGLDHWGNPALLGAERGVSYEWTRTQLVPELANDVILRTDVIKLAQGGAGVVISGRPFGAGVHLDYGESEGTDQSGNPTGMFASFEKVKSWGFGANLLETFESVTQLPGRSGNPLSRYFDVGFGMNFKHLDMFLGPGGGAGSTSALDWGTTVRVTPIDLVSRDGTPVRLDASFGLSVLSANDDALVVFL